MNYDILLLILPWIFPLFMMWQDMKREEKGEL